MPQHASIAQHSLSAVPILHGSRSRLRSNSPRPQRQRLYPHHRWLDVSPECHYSNQDAEHVDNVIPVSRHVAQASAIYTTVLFRFESTRKRLRDKGPFQSGLGRLDGWDACRLREHVDSLEHKVAWECSAKVRDSAS